MLQRVLSYILRYMHIGNLLKKNRTYPAHIFVKGISSELLYFFNLIKKLSFLSEDTENVHGQSE